MRKLLKPKRRHYKCKSCSYEGFQSRQFLYHLRDAHGVRSPIYPCNLCEYASRHKCKVLRHRSQIHKSAPLLNADDVIAEGRAPRKVDVNGNSMHVTSKQVLPSTSSQLMQYLTATKPANHEPSTVEPAGSDVRAVPKKTDDASRLITDADSTFDNPHFSCTECPFSDVHKWMVLKHVREKHLKNKLYKCPSCDFTTQRKIDLCAHKTTHSTKEIFACGECAYKTTMKKNYERHVANHGADLPNKCSFCSYSSTGESAVHRHMAEYHSPRDQHDGNVNPELEFSWRQDSPTPTPDGPVKCPECDEIQPSYLQLKDHLKLHGHVSPHVCPMCPCKYKRSSDLNRHMKKKHSIRLKDFQDRISCKKPDVQDEPLNLSVTKETDDAPLDLSTKANVAKTETYQCTLCSHTAKYPCDLKRHLSVHSIKKPFKCPHCEKGYKHRYDLTSHIRDCHPSETQTKPTQDEPKPEPETETGLGQLFQSESNICSFCNYIGKCKSEIERHMRMHTGEKPHACPSCDYKTNWGGDIKRHIQKYHSKDSDETWKSHVTIVEEEGETIEVGESFKPLMKDGEGDTWTEYKCSSCPFTCQSSTILSVHMEAHSLALFQCVYCDHRSKWVNDLKCHIRKAHPGKSEDFKYLSEEEARGIDKSSQSDEPEVKDDVADFDIECKEREIEDLKKELEAYKCCDVLPTQVNVEPLYGHVYPEFKKAKYASKVANKYRPFKCSNCGRRSNWRWDLNKHIREAHPGAEMVTLSHEEAKSTFAEYIKSTGLPPNKSETDVKEDNLDSLSSEVKRWKCSLCPYRSNYRSDIGRHGKRIHRGLQWGVVQLQVEEAAATLDEYKETWAKKKFVLSPAKAVGMQVIGEDMEMSDAELQGNGSDDEVMRQESSEDTVLNIQEDVRKRWWKCPRCSYKHKSKQVLTSHMKDGCKTKKYTCKLCGDYSCYRGSMIKHVKIKHDKGEDEFDTYVTEDVVFNKGNVPTNGASFPIRVVASYHKRAVLNTESTFSFSTHKQQGEGQTKTEGKMDEYVRSGNIYWCKGCPYHTTKKQLLVIHLSYHKQQPGHDLKCTSCNFWAHSQGQIRKHEKVHSESYGAETLAGSPKKDEEGTKTGQSEGNGLSQMVHKAMKYYNHHCDKCPFTTKGKKELIYHKQFHRHKATAPFKCDRCDYWVSSRRNLTQHMKVHEPSYVLAYSRNGSSIDGKESLVVSPVKSDLSDLSSCNAVEIASLKHQIIASKVTAVPVTPEKLFPGEYDNSCMEGVVINKDGEILQSTKFKKFYKCGACPFATVRVANLQVHQRMHEKEGRTDNQFSCRYCTYSCGNKPLLNQHMKVHSAQYKPGQEHVTKLDLRADDEEEEEEEEEKEEKPEGSEETEKEAPNSPVHEYKVFNKPVVMNGISVAAGEVPNNTGYMIKYDAMSDNHIIEKAQFKKYRCERCPYGTTERSLFERHCMLHGSKQRYVCEYCDYSVPDYPLLAPHQKLHMKPNPNLLSMQSISNLQHLPQVPADIALAMNFAGDSPTKSEDGDLDISFYEESEDYVEPKKLYRCDHCPYSSRQREQLLSHLSHHMNPAEHQCNYCDYSMSKPELLHHHVKLHFNGVDAQPEYIDISELPPLSKKGEPVKDLNENIAEKDEPMDTEMICRYCDRVFEGADMLVKHEMQHMIGNKCMVANR